MHEAIIKSVRLFFYKQALNSSCKMLRGVTMNYEMLDQSKLNELDAYINSFEDKPSHLIMILHRAQGLFGYLPKELQIYVAEKTGVPSAKVYGVVTFYSFFTMKPRGRHTISCCMGTACFVKGGERILDVVKEGSRYRYLVYVSIRFYPNKRIWRRI